MLEGTTSSKCACLFISLVALAMLAVAEWPKARDCGSRLRGFESRPSTQFKIADLRISDCELSKINWPWINADQKLRNFIVLFLIQIRVNPRLISIRNPQFAIFSGAVTER